jgi:hypothetical protein
MLGKACLIALACIAIVVLSGCHDGYYAANYYYGSGYRPYCGPAYGSYYGYSYRSCGYGRGYGYGGGYYRGGRCH